jgi:DNA-binding response OmpR family regulator
MIPQNEAKDQSNIQDYLQSGAYQAETEPTRTNSSFLAPLTGVVEHDQIIATSVSTAFIRNGSRTDRQVNMSGAGFAMVTRNPDPLDVFVYADVTISFSAMEVRRSGQLIPLTLKEFNTLSYLLKNTPRVISRDELLNEVWGYESYPCTRTVDNHILRLRKKLEPGADRPKHLRTVHGMGYRFLP